MIIRIFTVADKYLFNMEDDGDEREKISSSIPDTLATVSSVEDASEQFSEDIPMMSSPHLVSQTMLTGSNHSGSAFVRYR
mmetsp:Transcript_9591/g.20768  ORF Transcript_9591/g.20768 Transcript_9591/m.20768 type:complete len:80 (-) Transcript_9591:824-1063(-)